MLFQQKRRELGCPSFMWNFAFFTVQMIVLFVECMLGLESDEIGELLGSTLLGKVVDLLTDLDIQAAFRTDEIRRTPPTPQDEMRAGMSYFHETIWKGVPKFLRRVDTALKNIGTNERVPYNAPLIQFSSWMGGDRDGAKRMVD